MHDFKAHILIWAYGFVSNVPKEEAWRRRFLYIETRRKMTEDGRVIKSVRTYIVVIINYYSVLFET